MGLTVYIRTIFPTIHYVLHILECAFSVMEGDAHDHIYGVSST